MRPGPTTASAGARVLACARRRPNTSAIVSNRGRSVHAFLSEMGAKIVHAPQDDSWAPGYYSVLFEDPDGVRLEINHVPGKGLLAAGGSGHLGAQLG